MPIVSCLRMRLGSETPPPPASLCSLPLGLSVCEGESPRGGRTRGGRQDTPLPKDLTRTSTKPGVLRGPAVLVRSGLPRFGPDSAQRAGMSDFVSCILVAWSPPHFSGATWPRAPHVLPRVFANVDVGLGTTLTLTLTLIFGF